MSLLKHQMLYEALTSNEALMAKVSCITDEPLPDVQAPYIVMGETYEGNGELVDNSCAAVVVTLHIWSNYRGRKEVLEIRDLLVAALPNWCLFEMFEVNSDTERDSQDSVWWHGIFEIRYFDERK